MIRPWFRDVALKVLSSCRLDAETRITRRLRARPRLETLEDRTVTSTMTVEPPWLSVTSTAQGATVVNLGFEIHPGDSTSAAADITKLIGLNGPALERLLADIHTLEIADSFPGLF